MPRAKFEIAKIRKKIELEEENIEKHEKTVVKTFCFIENQQFDFC